MNTWLHSGLSTPGLQIVRTRPLSHLSHASHNAPSVARLSSMQFGYLFSTMYEARLNNPRAIQLVRLGPPIKLSLVPMGSLYLTWNFLLNKNIWKEPDI